MTSKQCLPNKAKIPLLPLHRYHPNQTPPTWPSLYLHSCLHLKLNIHTTKFNYLVPKPDTPFYSFSSIHYPRDLRFLIQPLNSVFLNTITSFPLLTPTLTTHSNLSLPTQSSQTPMDKSHSIHIHSKILRLTE